MKHKIFISYSDYDKDKVKLIVEKLEGNEKFESLVIAFNREALKPLAQKVADGINQCEIIIPILTKKSISTQWINQEIGYATAIGKRIMPIVESNLIDQLKGFIHKQIDLPYNYQTNIESELENDDFMLQFNNLLLDLDLEFANLNSDSKEQTQFKSEFEKSLDELDRMNSALQLKQKKINFLSSVDGIKVASCENSGCGGSSSDAS